MTIKMNSRMMEQEIYNQYIFELLTIFIDYDNLQSIRRNGGISMSEEIKVHPIKSFKDYGLAKRSFEELTKKNQFVTVGFGIGR